VRTGANSLVGSSLLAAVGSPVAALEDREGVGAGDRVLAPPAPGSRRLSRALPEHPRQRLAALRHLGGNQYRRRGGRTTGPG